MANINCGNCGSTHASVAEVRSCHQSRPSSEQLESDSPYPESPTEDALKYDNAGTLLGDAATNVGAVASGPGPDALGRSALVRWGAAAPQGWADAKRVGVDTANIDHGTIVDLHRAWAQRERLVIEIKGKIPEPTTFKYDALWKLDPGLELSADRLRFLLTANVVDHRDNNGVWWAIGRAVELGATVGDDSLADIVLPDGTDAWVDGGPFSGHSLDGTTVIHTTQLEAGTLSATVSVSGEIDLAPDQLRAVNHGCGPARIIAPAGSGKTRVLTERARHLLRNCAFPQGALTLVAFNKRAQLEMQERTADLPGLRVRTLNSLGLAILRGTGPFLRSTLVEKNVEVITEHEVRSILDALLDLPRRANVDQLAPWIEALTAVRLGLRDPDEVERSFGGDVDGLAKLVARYRGELRRKGVVDFDEQIVAAIEVLLGDPAARVAAQRSCRAMLVDEFQDLTPAHLLLVRLLGTPGFDVFGVGDDDQTIYGFTGARPDWLIDFRQWFPEAEHYALEVNYRCPPAVIEAAGNLLTHNLRRVDKEISPPTDRTATSTDFAVIGTDDSVRETRQRVGDLTMTDVDPSDIVVLTRVNASLAPIQVALAMDGIPVEQAVGQVFLNRSGVRAVLAWLRLASSGTRFDPSDIEAAARRPSRGLAPRVVEWMSEQHDINGLRRLARRLKDRDAVKVDTFVDDLNALIGAAKRSATTAELIQIIRDEIGLAGSLDALDASRRTVNRSSHNDDLEAMLALGRLQPDAPAFEAWLRQHLSEPGDPDGVRLSTIHKVKGREWPHVIVVGVDAERLPHRLSTDVEEERRVFHVAITRGINSTAVVFAAAEKSVFIGELTQARDPSAAPTPTPDTPATRVRPVPQTDLDDPLRQSLKIWRRERSQLDQVPAYVIFNDKTLDDLLLRKPVDLAELALCHGIGPAKLDRFGDELLGALSDGIP